MRGDASVWLPSVPRETVEQVEDAFEAHDRLTPELPAMGIHYLPNLRDWNAAPHQEPDQY